MYRRDISIELQRLVHETADVSLTQADCLAILAGLQSALVSTLVAGEEVRLSDFGKLSVHTRQATRKSHPRKAGEIIEIPSKKVVKFTPYGSLKDIVNP